MSTVGVDLLVNLVDRLSAPLRNTEQAIAQASERMNRRLRLSMQVTGTGAAAAGVAFGAQRMVTGFTNSLDEVHRASGDLAALGVQDLEMIMARGRDMQMNWVGLTADTFVSAAYDIRSGISSLTDEGVANVTGTAAIVARATRSEIGTMTNLMAGAYDVYRQQFADMTDSAWAEMFGATLTAAVQQFRTDGAAMQQAIESAGAGAIQLGMSMTEQMALLGMMQGQMQAGEAGTALAAFARNAYRAHEAFSEMDGVRVRLIDNNGQLRAMPDILADLRARYGETLEAAEAYEIQQAFGTDEAMRLINALYGQEDAVRANADALADAGAQGAEYTEQVARATQQSGNWHAISSLVSQKLDVLWQVIGEQLVPVFERLTPYFDAAINGMIGWIDANPELVSSIGTVVVVIGAIAAAIAPVLLAAGTLMSSWAVMSYGATRLGLTIGRFGGTLLWVGRVALPLVARSVGLIGRALIANPIGLAVMAIAGAAYLIYQYWEPISAFFVGLWSDVKGAFAQGVAWVNEAVGAVLGFDWSGLFSLEGLSAAWGAVTGFMGPALGAVWDTLHPLAWLGLVNSDGLATAWGAVTRFVTSSAESIWASIVGVNWSSLVSLDGLRAAWGGVVAFFTGWEWSDILPDWDWGAIIPDLPDFSGLFGGEETLPDRLAGIAEGGWGNWERGVELVEQYRAGVIGLADLHAEVASAARDGADGRAQAMLAELNAELQISNPQSLMEAASAADELQARLPAISEAAQATLMAAQSALASIAATLAETNFANEGARLVTSIAEGMRGQIGAVRAAAAAIAATIRATLPANAAVSVSMRGAAAAQTVQATVQARASGGSFRPGWLLTGEEGPELEYRSEGGFIAHNQALRRMVAMAERVRDLVGNGMPAPGQMRAIPSTATIAGVSGQMRAGGHQVSYAPVYNVTVPVAPGADMDEVRRAIRAELMDAEERAQVELRRLMHD